MAATLKHWRESASLIIASRKLVMKPSKQSFLQKLTFAKPATQTESSEELLRLLLLKRGVGSSFMPNVYVFPGGIIEKEDFSKQWLDLYVNNCVDGFNNIFKQNNDGSPIFSRVRDEQFTAIPSELALRISAIRETFEESGILLARAASEKQNNLFLTEKHPCTCQVFDMSDNQKTEWMGKVSKDSSQFFIMCKELGVVPDVWGLYEWSNWLTPLLRNTRFDTAFFIACVDEGPPIVGSSETEHGLWVSPRTMLSAAARGVVNLAPPQIYELSRLSRLRNVDDLMQLSWKRSHNRSDRWMPVLFECPDGIIFTLPGDDLYPLEPDLTGEITGPVTALKESFGEIQKLYPNHHRAVIYKKDKQLSLFCNIEFVGGHILPVEFNKKSDVDWSHIMMDTK